jgi:succinate dehydrogenase / fumarate reductase flavoprotein subunit
MEVGPTAHYVMGGVRVDADTGAATVPGLFAAGESSGGMHGANRLGGNSLSDLLVFGRRAGAGAAAYAAKTAMPGALDAVQVTAAEREMLEPFERASGPDPYSIHRRLQDSMQSLVGIFRTDEDLKKGIAAVAELRREIQGVRVEGSRAFNPGWHLAHDLRNLLLISEAVARCALQRKESRGAHARLDHPNPDPAFGTVNSVTTLQGEEVRVAQSPLPTMPDELRSMFEEPAVVKS